MIRNEKSKNNRIEGNINKSKLKNIVFFQTYGAIKWHDVIYKGQMIQRSKNQIPVQLKNMARSFHLKPNGTLEAHGVLLQLCTE
jgi:hypothetical protein